MCSRLRFRCPEAQRSVKIIIYSVLINFPFHIVSECDGNPEIEAQRRLKEEKKRLRLEKEALALQGDIDAKIEREKVALWRKIEKIVKKNDEVCDE